MFRNVALTAVFILVLSIISASEPVTAQSNIMAILPENCRIQVGEELSLELRGSLPSNAVATWEVDYGSVASVLPGLNAVLVAPTKPSVITVYATITGVRPGRWIYVTRQCIVTPNGDISG